MIKKLSIALSVLTITTATFASETNHPDKELVAEYLVAAKFKETADVSVSTIIESLPKNTPPKQLEEEKTILNKTIGWDSVKEQTADLVARTYTKQELEAYIEFSKNPVGASYSNKTVEFNKGEAEITIQRWAKVKKELTIK